MALYIYYDIGGGVHNSKDDVAVVRTISKKSAVKKLTRYLVKVDPNKITKLGGRFNTKDKVAWISEY